MSNIGCKYSKKSPFLDALFRFFYSSKYNGNNNSTLRMTHKEPKTNKNPLLSAKNASQGTKLLRYEKVSCSVLGFRF